MKVIQSYTPGPKSDPSSLASTNEWRPDRATQDHAICFLDKYSWQRIAEVTETHLVVEDVGRNTECVWAWRFEGTPEEIQPLNQYLYLCAAVDAACYCALGADYREGHAAKTAERLQRFPKNAHMPLPFACLCFQEPEFVKLAEVFTSQIATADSLTLLERIPSQSERSDYEWSSTTFASSIAAILVAGISKLEDVVAAVTAVSTYPDPKEVEDLLLAVEFEQEGICSFQEALVS